MDFNEKVRIIAIAKLCGIALSNDDILKKYNEYLKEISKELSENSAPAVVEVVKRPF
ncbi:MAG: hypothetical protein RR902_03045 [Oscillospiraceae bacterium]